MICYVYLKVVPQWIRKELQETNSDTFLLFNQHTLKWIAKETLVGSWLSLEKQMEMWASEAIKRDPRVKDRYFGFLLLYVLQPHAYSSSFYVSEFPSYQMMLLTGSTRFAINGISYSDSFTCPIIQSVIFALFQSGVRYSWISYQYFGSNRRSTSQLHLCVETVTYRMSCLIENDLSCSWDLSWLFWAKLFHLMNNNRP